MRVQSKGNLGKVMQGVKGKGIESSVEVSKVRRSSRRRADFIFIFICILIVSLVLTCKLYVGTKEYCNTLIATIRVKQVEIETKSDELKVQEEKYAEVVKELDVQKEEYTEAVQKLNELEVQFSEVKSEFEDLKK